MRKIILKNELFFSTLLLALSKVVTKNHSGRLSENPVYFFTPLLVHQVRTISTFGFCTNNTDLENQIVST